MLSDLTLLAARLTLGKSTVAHGMRKAFGSFGGPGPEAAAESFAKAGFRPGAGFAALAAWNEIGAGTLITLGLGGPAGPAMLIGEMAVAATVHMKRGWFTSSGGAELPMLYAVGAALLAAGGHGTLSLDHQLGLRAKLRGPVPLALALAGAAAGSLIALQYRSTAGEGRATPTFQGKNSPLPPL
jgi:putative oxidoreductase